MKQEIIVKSNEVLDHPIYKTPVELKIFSKIILELRKAPESNVFYLNKKDLLNSLGCDKNSYGELKKIAERMFRPIDINKGKGDFILRAVFMEINASFESEILFEISPKMKPYFLDLSKNFTQYDFENIARMRSSFSIRIYEFLKQYERIGLRKSSVIEIRYFLNISDDKYLKYSNFKNKVLLVAQKELKEKTDLYFEFEEIKTGRKITDINFIIFKNIKTVEEVGEEDDTLTDEQKELKAKLIGYGLAEKVVNELILAVSSTQIQQNIAYTEKEHKKGKVSKNFAGYLLDAIKNNYANNTTIFEEAEKKKQVDARREEQREEQKKALISQLSKKFDTQEREKFISSLSEEQGKTLLAEILEEEKLNSFAVSNIKKAGLKSIFAYPGILKRIDNFEERKEAFIAEGLKELNL